MNTNIIGTENDDILQFDNTAIQVLALSGDDRLEAISGAVYSDIVINGGNGTDTLTSSGTLKIGSGVTFKEMETLDVAKVKVISNATVDLSGFETSTATKIIGSGGSETIYGTQGADVIITRGGDDFVWANAGDLVKMGAGNDTLQFLQDGTATISVNAKGNGKITYKNGDVIRFRGVENFEEITPEPPVQYTIDFNFGTQIYDGDTVLGTDGKIVAKHGAGLSPFSDGFIGTNEFDGSDSDNEGFNAYATKVVGFEHADGDTFEFVSLSLANGSTSTINDASKANVVELIGWNDGVEIYSQTVQLSDAHETYELNWADIDAFQIVVIGGSQSGNGITDTGAYSMDDLVFIA